MLKADNTMSRLLTRFFSDNFMLNKSQSMYETVMSISTRSTYTWRFREGGDLDFSLDKIKSRQDTSLESKVL